MQIMIRIKALGKKKNILNPTPYEIPDSVASLRMLLTALVEFEVKEYNKKGTDVQLVPWLTKEEINDMSDAGKVGFGRIFSEKKADSKKAVSNALQCFEDGLIRVFMNDSELVKLDKHIEISAGAEFTFIRLAFLAGRMW